MQETSDAADATRDAVPDAVADASVDVARDASADVSIDAASDAPADVAEASPPPPPVDGGMAVYPIKASPNQRYLVDQNGQPFLLMGFTEHNIVTNIDPGVNSANYQTIFQTRASMGFNAVWVEALVNDYLHNPSGCTFDGICPFIGTNSKGGPTSRTFN